MNKVLHSNLLFFAFTTDWMRKWCEIFKPIAINVVMQN